MAIDWDVLAASYRAQESLERLPATMAVALADPRPEDVVVDLGCGPGTLVRQLDRTSRPVRRLIGVDSSIAMLRRAADVGMTVVQADVGAAPLPDGIADVVVCAWVLHVVDRSARADALREVERLLQPGGRATLVIPARPRTVLGRALRAVARRTVSRGVLDVVDVDTPLREAGLVVADRRHVGVFRWSYEADVVLVRPAAREAQRSPQP